MSIAGVIPNPENIAINELNDAAYANWRIGTMSLTERAISPRQVVSVAMHVGHQHKTSLGHDVGMM